MQRIIITNMYIKIGSTIYREITNLSFAPEVDITGQSLPINEFFVDIYTEADIAVGQWIFLYDDLDNLWAKYWLIFADRITAELVTIHAQSYLAKYDRMTVEQAWYDTTLESVLFNPANLNLSTNIVSMHPDFYNVHIIGYCPEQTMKERIQWLCIAVGAYVKTFFTDKIEIVPIDNSITEIPVEKTFWRPSIASSDYVSDINVTSFSYEWTSVRPQSYEEYVDFGNAGVERFLKITRLPINTHRQVPANVPTTEINLEDVFLVNSSNVTAISNRLASIYFMSQELEADVINNAEYIPADKVKVSLDPPDEDTGRTAEGFIDSCDFSFGVMARSRIRLAIQGFSVTTKLIVNYLKGSIKLGRNKYQFPVGSTPTIPNPYLEQTSGKKRYVYYPINPNTVVTIQAGTNVSNQQYDFALIFNGDKKVLWILSVSGVAWQNDEEREVLVIE